MTGRIPSPVVQIWDATGTTLLGALAGVTRMTISHVLSDVGTLTLTVPRNVAGAEQLDTDDDRQLRLLLPGAPAMWWVLDDDRSTWVSDDPAGEPLDITCRDLSALLDEAIVPPADGIGTTPAEWAWTDATPGQVMTDLWTAAQTRGLLQGVTLDATPTLDASDTPWPDTVTVTHRAGTTLLQVLAALRDAGLVEHRWADRTLELHRPGGDLDRSPDITLRPRRDVTAAPLERSRRSLTTDVVVECAAGETVRRSQTLPGRRRRETYVTESGLDSVAGAAAGDLYLAAHAAADVQITHDLTDGEDTPRPWIDYRVGDRVRTIAAGPRPTRRRIQQIALELADTVTVTLELGSILRTAEETMTRQIARLGATDGAVS